MLCKPGWSVDGWLASQPRVCAVITKEAVMSETFRAFLYGFLILATALIPPVVSLMEKLSG
jgi:hypothetical protein